MKIYRFVPVAAGRAVVTKTLAERWWPDGINFGTGMARMLPKGPQWAHLGNRYRQYPEDQPLPDFPAFAFNVPLLSQKAAAILRSAGLVDELVLVHVADKPFFAVQYRKLPDVFRPDSSEGLALPRGEIFHFYRRDFDESKATAEFFSLPVFGPFTDLYFTERLLAVSQEAGLTGLESCELVYDNGPVTVRYPKVDRALLPDGTLRRRLEWELLYWRAAVLDYDESVIRDAIENAAAEGWISFDEEATKQLP